MTTTYTLTVDGVQQKVPASQIVNYSWHIPSSNSPHKPYAEVEFKEKGRQATPTELTALKKLSETREPVTRYDSAVATSWKAWTFTITQLDAMTAQMAVDGQ